MDGIKDKGRRENGMEGGRGANQRVRDKCTYFIIPFT